MTGDNSDSRRGAQEIMDLLGEMLGAEGPPVNDDTPAELFGVPEDSKCALLTSVSIHIPTSGVLVEQTVVDEEIYGHVENADSDDFDDSMEGVVEMSCLVTQDMMPRINDLMETATHANETGERMPGELSRAVGKSVKEVMDAFEEGEIDDNDGDDGDDGFDIEVE